ncbi:unnamed protein product, partial [Effrenium voratum]
GIHRAGVGPGRRHGWREWPLRSGAIGALRADGAPMPVPNVRGKGVRLPGDGGHTRTVPGTSSAGAPTQVESRHVRDLRVAPVAWGLPPGPRGPATVRAAKGAAVAARQHLNGG